MEGAEKVGGVKREIVERPEGAPVRMAGLIGALIKVSVPDGTGDRDRDVVSG